MTIVLNEDRWAEEMIRNKTLGKRPFETMCRVAKYYLSREQQRREVRKKLDDFLIECNPTASLPKWADTIDYAVAAAAKQKLLRAEYISISENEMEAINSLSGAQLQRLAFTLLCLSKYWMLVNPKSDGWVNNDDSEVMKLANINTSIKRQCLLYHGLRDAGMIQFSKKIDNTNVRVLFANDGSEALRVSDFRNLGYQYMMFRGDPRYIRCQACGLVMRDKSVSADGKRDRGRKRKYCDACAEKASQKQLYSTDTDASVC